MSGQPPRQITLNLKYTYEGQIKELTWKNVKIGLPFQSSLLCPVWFLTLWNGPRGAFWQAVGSLSVCDATLAAVTTLFFTGAGLLFSFEKSLWIMSFWSPNPRSGPELLLSALLHDKPLTAGLRHERVTTLSSYTWVSWLQPFVGCTSSVHTFYARSQSRAQSIRPSFHHTASCLIS